MEQSQLVIKSNRALAIFGVLGMTGLVAFMGYYERNKLFDWEHFNSNGINSIIFLLFLAFCLMAWVILFYDPPRFKLDKDGIWKRKNWFSASLVRVVSWDNINYYYIEVKSDRAGVTKTLIIRRKDPDQDIRMGITDIDVSQEKILHFIKQYSVIYGFNDFVRELG